jgi:phosphatidylglycerol:prolipoprotein diacylglycerol transferase
MYPILFKIGFLEIRTYGVILFIAFMVAMLYLKRKATRAGIPKEAIYDLTFWVILSAIVGSRILYVIYEWELFSKNIWEIFAIWEGGLVFYGGVLLAIPTAIIYMVRRKLPLWRMADWIAPGFALGIAVGRWGCFFNGCCYGKPTSLPWGVVFPSFSAAGSTFHGIPVHPTQIYESLAEFIVFLLLIRIERVKPFDGFVFWIFIIFAASIRFLVDFLRYYEPGVRILSIFNVNQVVSAVLIIIAVFMIAILRKRR